MLTYLLTLLLLDPLTISSDESLSVMTVDWEAIANGSFKCSQAGNLIIVTNTLTILLSNGLTSYYERSQC